jgi:hypothetical protein
MQRFIADPLVPENDKMNSIQQGFLCLATEHKLFDDYQIGVNPDVCFAYQQSLPTHWFLRPG